MAKKIKLQSSDLEIFEVDEKVAKMSITIKTMLEAVNDDDDDDEVVHLPRIESSILTKVFAWAEKHVDDSAPPEDNRVITSDDISQWDTDFLNVDRPTLFAIVLAANFLDIKGLLDVSCKTIANMIKEKSVEEIRETFNITPMALTDDNEAAQTEEEDESSEETSSY